MADEDLSLKIDLDAKDAVASAQKLQKTISELGESDLSGLIHGFTELAAPIALAGAGLFSFKKAFDLSLEGAQLERLDQQFNQLAEDAGISGEALRENIKEAIGPTNNLEDAIKSANKALVALGPTLSNKIPEYFEIARKAARVFGGDINERFQQITMSIESGNTRFLKQIGLTLDANKAMAAYAKSIGATVETLSQQGKQIAISNAIQDKAAEKYKNINTQTVDLVSAWQSFSATIKEVSEVVAVAFNKMFGPTFQTILTSLTNQFKIIGNDIKAHFGDGLEKANAQLDGTKARLAELNNEMKRYHDAGIENKPLADMIDVLNKKLETQTNLQKALAEEELKRQAAKNADKIIEKGPGGEVGKDEDKIKLQNAAFQQELLKQEKTRLDSEMNLETDAIKFKEDLKSQEVIFEKQEAAKIAQINAEVGEGKKYTAAQASQLIIQLEAAKTAKIKSLQEDEKNAVMKSYDNRVKYAKTAAEGMSAAFAQGAAKAKKDLNDFGLIGQKTFDSVKSNSIKAFKAMGDGSKSAGDAMKSFLLDSIADVTEMQGEQLLAYGIGTFNPVPIAEGGALIALASAMRSAAGTSGGSSSGGGSSGGAPSAASPSGGSSQSSMPSAPSPQDQKVVTIQVQGHYFETEQTKTAMVDLIRQATDATAFKYQQIGIS